MSERCARRKGFSVLLVAWIAFEFVACQDWANDRIGACCRTMGTRDSCMSICRFDTTIDEVYDRHECYDQMKIWMYCASEGRDHTACCDARFVPPECHRFCSGNTPRVCLSDAKALQIVLDCAQFLDDILSCHRNNLEENPQWSADHKFMLEPEC